MTQNKNQNIIYLDANNLDGYAISKFLATGDLNGQILKCLMQINIAAIVCVVVF